MTIYVDVLLAVNLYINYFLVRGTAILMRRDISAKRCILSAAAGAAFSPVILFPELPFIVTVLIKAGSGALIVLLAFGASKTPDFIISLLCFLLISFVYAGLMLGLWIFAAPFGMFYRNGTAYFDIPIIAVALFTAAAYGIVRLLRYISDRRAASARYAEISITAAGRSVKLRGLADTGNSLCEPFGGKPVIICPLEKLGELAPPYVHEYFGGGTELEGLRLVPCHTLGGRTLLPVFGAEEITVDGRRADAVIGVYDRQIEGAECIFNPNLISL